MPTNIFVSYPTANLDRSKAFYTALGATINLLVGEGGEELPHQHHEVDVLVPDEAGKSALHRRERLADPAITAQVQIAFSRDSREDVDTVVEAGLAAGGSEPRPAQDFGFMYSRDLEDPDGNIVAFLYMVLEAAEQGPEAYHRGRLIVLGLDVIME
jgi:uncharacterized protein